MSNARNTPIEALERAYPFRVERYALRRGSGGAGARRGGDGVVRELRVLAPLRLSVIAQRRQLAPRGAAGGCDGARGRTLVDGVEQPASVSLDLEPGSVSGSRRPAAAATARHGG